MVPVRKRHNCRSEALLKGGADKRVIGWALSEEVIQKQLKFCKISDTVYTGDGQKHQVVL